METGFRPTGVVEVQTEYSRRLKASRAEHYLYGPVRIADVRAASKLGGVCLVGVGRVLWLIVSEKSVVTPAG
jgi:hypothetical protein